MRTRTVAELREEIKTLAPSLSLEQIFAAKTSFETFTRANGALGNCQTEALVRAECVGRTIEVRARYITTGEIGGVDDTVPPKEAWTAMVEGVAIFALGDSFTEVTNGQVEAVGVLLGLPALHPYAREWTQTLTGQSQFPAFSMGLMDSPSELPADTEIEFPESGDVKDN